MPYHHKSLLSIQTHGRSEKLTAISNTETCMQTWQPLTHSRDRNSSLNEEAGHCWRQEARWMKARSNQDGWRSLHWPKEYVRPELPFWMCPGLATMLLMAVNHSNQTWVWMQRRGLWWCDMTCCWNHSNVVSHWSVGWWIAAAEEDNETTAGEVLGDVRRLCTLLVTKAWCKTSTLSLNQCSHKKY